MAEIELASLTKQFGTLTAVNKLDLVIPDRQFVALLGPSGCGKTTTMNMIAGVETPTGGDIRFNGKSVGRIPPSERGVGFVFQNYAIFTHMSVYDNLAFGLRARRLPDVTIKQKVNETAELMQLTRHLDWPSSRLSVNEMQKLAIGRSAIVEPAIFLLDEPLSNLDAAFREFMRTELKHIQHQLQQTMVYVTHDQIEAMSLADRIAVMDKGVLQQYGTPDEVYNAPENTFVANFMGSPGMNLVPCELSSEGDDLALDLGAPGRVAIADARLKAAAAASRERKVILGVRPELIELAETGDGPKMTVDITEPIGPRTIVHLSAGDVTMVVVAGKRAVIRPDTEVVLNLPQAKCHLFDAQSGAVLRGGNA